MIILRARQLGQNALRRFQPVHHRHFHIHNNDIRAQPLRLCDGLAAFHSLAHNFHVGLTRKLMDEQTPHQVRVLDNQHFNFGHGR